MNVVVGMLVTVFMVVEVALGMTVVSVHLFSLVFYVLRRQEAAFSTCSVVGWLTTIDGDFVDGSLSGCHYQKR
jgi:hypothetical protein